MVTADVRRVCGNVDRHTLLNWRAKRGFPEPIRAINLKRGQKIEIWDRRDVRRWLKENPPINERTP